MKTAAPVTRDFKTPGRTIILLGGIGDCDEARFGGTRVREGDSERSCGDCRRRSTWITRSACTHAMREIVAAGLAESAHDLSDGGLAVAAAECCFGRSRRGARSPSIPDFSPELLLFHEGPSRILLSTADPDAVAEIAARHGVEALARRHYIESGLAIRQSRRATLISVNIDSLRTIYEGSLENQLRS